MGALVSLYWRLDSLYRMREFLCVKCYMMTRRKEWGAGAKWDGGTRLSSTGLIKPWALSVSSNELRHGPFLAWRVSQKFLHHGKGSCFLQNKGKGVNFTHFPLVSEERAQQGLFFSNVLLCMHVKRKRGKRENECQSQRGERELSTMKNRWKAQPRGGCGSGCKWGPLGCPCPLWQEPSRNTSI